ncbi:MAG: CPBP family intramembrane metalloprotease [Clostridia bacterium]|nr:CPBP family intramembrane metalloprotease [Clostridia bacterium]
MKLKPYTTVPFLAALVYLLTICAEQLLAGLDTSAKGYLYALCGIQFAAYALPLLLYGLLFGGIRPRRMRLAFPSAASIPLQFLLLAILLVGTSLTSMFLHRVGIITDTGAGSTAVSSVGFLAIVIAALVPAVCEEILFRGIIMSSFEECGVSPAIIGSSLLFAFAHMSFEELPVYFFAGVVLAFSAYVSRSVFTAIFLHAVYNVASLCFGDYLYAIAAHLESFSLLFIIMFFTLLILVLISLSEGERVYGIYARRALDSSYTPKKMTRIEKIKGNAAVYLSVPFLLATLIYIAVVVFSMQK